MLCSLPIAIIGYAVIANTHIAKVKYGMTFLMATGLYSSVPPVLGWLSNVSMTRMIKIVATRSRRRQGTKISKGLLVYTYVANNAI